MTDDKQSLDATTEQRSCIIGWIESQRGIYTRQAARETGLHRASSIACLSVCDDALSMLREGWKLSEP